MNNAQQRQHRKRRVPSGFTLVELIVVVAIIGVLSTMVIMRYSGKTDQAKVVAAKAPRNLRRHNARILSLDEIDGMESGAEGSPISFADRDFGRVDSDPGGYVARSTALSEI